MKILGLDISGSSTGWAFGQDHRLINYGKYITNLKLPRSQRLYEFNVWLESLFQDLQPDIILIERPYLGRNSNVLANLSKFVAAAEIAVFKILHKSIEDTWFLDPRTVKRIVKVKKPRGKKSSTHDINKKIMVIKINELYGLKLKYKQGKNKTYCDDDIADAIALLHAWWNINNT